MKKVIRLKESELTNLVKRIVNEEKENHWVDFGFDDEESFINNYKIADDYASDLFSEIIEEIETQISFFLSENLDLNEIVSRHKNDFMKKYGKYHNNDMTFYNEGIDDLMRLRTKNINYDFLSSEITDVITDYLMKNNEKNY
jgi:hypothetical protein